MQQILLASKAIGKGMEGRLSHHLNRFRPVFSEKENHLPSDFAVSCEANCNGRRSGYRSAVVG